MSFAETLRKLMEEKQESNSALARELMVSNSTIANWLNGTPPTRCHVMLLEKHYGTKLTEVDT